MTVRELIVSLGFEIDAGSEKKVEAAVQGLKKAASTALGAVNTEPIRAGARVTVAAFKGIGDAVRDTVAALHEEAEAQQTTVPSAEKLRVILIGVKQAVQNVRNVFQGLKKPLEDTAPSAKKLQDETKKTVSILEKLLKMLKKPFKAVVKPKVDEHARQKVENVLQGLHSMAVRLLGAIGIGFSLVNMNALAEEFNGVNDMIRNATRDLGEQESIQKAILASANEMKSSYADTAKIVSNLVQESPDLFGSVADAANFASLTTKLFKSTGKGQEEINGLQEAINKSFAKGIVDSETINQLYEKAPEAINMIADSLGVAKENLAKMATDGVIKVADLKNAFVSSADVINRKFGELDFSISDALLNIRNQWGYWLDQINSTTGFSKNIGKFMVESFAKVTGGLNKLFDGFERITKAIGGYKNTLKLAAMVAGSLWGAMNGKKILDFLKGAKSLLSVANLKVMAIAAAVLALFLIIDDIINFVKGNDSVIGKLFEKAGIDSEKVRETILKAWGTVTAFLGKTWEWIKNAAHKIFEGLISFWDRWGGQIMAQAMVLWGFLVGKVQAVIRIFQGLMEFIAGVFTLDWERAWRGIREIFGGILDIIYNNFLALWNTLHNWFGEKIDAVVETLVNGFDGAVEFMESLPEKALQWGRDFIDGLVNGIKEKMNAVTEAVSGVGDKIKSFLHFSVPDEGPLTDYESWMPDFMDGLARGIKKHSPKVLDAIRALSDDMSLFGNVTVKNATASSVIGGGSRTTNVQQTNHITNQFEGGERAAQTQGAKAMGQVSKDATAEMARALATGR